MEEFPLTPGGGHRLVLDRERARIRLRHDRGDLRSPLHQALRHHLELIHGEERWRFPPEEDALPLPAGVTALEVRLGRRQALALGSWQLDGGAADARTLSPLEARFLARNGYPAPAPSASGPLPQPRSDLHTHFAGCPRAGDLLRLGREAGLSYPAALLAELGVRLEGRERLPLSELPPGGWDRLEEALAVPLDRRVTFRDMERIYRLRAPLTKARALLLPLLRQIAADYRAAGVRYAELSLADVVEAARLEQLRRELPALEAATGVRLRFLAAFSRHDDPEWDQDLIARVQELAPCPLLVGVDFMGHETNSTRDFAPQLRALAEWADRERPGFVIRVHAGENPAFPENVAVALDCTEGLRVRLRIGHGLYGVDDATLARLVARRVVVEFNLNSNFALNNVQSAAEVPLLRYVRAGARVVLGSDGYGIYQTSAAEEARAASLAGLGPGELAAIAAGEAELLDEQEAWEAAHPEPPGWAVPPDPAPRFFPPEVVARRRAAAKARERRLLARLDELGVPLLEGEALTGFLRGRRVVSVAGAWLHSWQRVSPKEQERVRALFRALADALEPREVVWITGGTCHGVEGLVHELVRPRGFQVLGALVRETPPDSLTPGALSQACLLGVALHDKAAGLYRLLQTCDGVALFVGGGNIVSDEIRVACNLRLPILLLEGPEGASSEHARLQPQRAVRSAEEVLAALQGRRRLSAPAPFWHRGVNPTVDLVVLRRRPGDGAGEVLLIRRHDDAPAEGGKWALPGGFVPSSSPRGEPWRPADETPRQTCLREAQEETGLLLGDLAERLVEVGVYEGGGRDPRDDEERWSRSTAFALELPDERAALPLSGGDDAQDARWVALDALPCALAFDHGRILTEALERLRAARLLRLEALDPSGPAAHADPGRASPVP